MNSLFYGIQYRGYLYVLSFARIDNEIVDHPTIALLRVRVHKIRDNDIDALSVIRTDRWFLSAVRSDKCGVEIELILCCYQNAIYACDVGKDGGYESQTTKRYHLISTMKTKCCFADPLLHYRFFKHR